jgi:hypothetical protein
MMLYVLMLLQILVVMMIRVTYQLMYFSVSSEVWNLVIFCVVLMLWAFGIGRRRIL